MIGPKHIKRKLDERKAANAFRSLTLHEVGVDFYSNDYLGLAKLRFENTADEGATGSRLISGNSKIATLFEQESAEFFNSEAALLYNSGYDANLGLFSCIAQRGDTILYDALIHASIRDGIQLSHAKSFNFRHNDYGHLEERLKQIEGTVFVAVESVYSMDGDQAPLKEIAKICQRFGAYLIVDEAHAVGVFGDVGQGLVSSLKLDHLVYAKLMTFGKAFGSHGAIVAGSQDLKDYLINFSRSLIYTTALPPASIQRLRFILNEVRRSKARRTKLFNLIDYFQNETKNSGFTLIQSHSPIQAVVIGETESVHKKVAEINQAGLIVKAILPPTVEKGKERIRICLHSFNTEEEIKKLISLL